MTLSLVRPGTMIRTCHIQSHEPVAATSTRHDAPSEHRALDDETTPPYSSAEPQPQGAHVTSSLRDILIQHYRLRLYLRTVLWSSEHVRLLGFRFKRRELGRKRSTTAYRTGPASTAPTTTAAATSSRLPSREPPLSSISHLRTSYNQSARALHILELLKACGLKDITEL
jgi:hypothetical protein